jgi:glycosyltransferase involved in cell wall biosynthesis
VKPLRVVHLLHSLIAAGKERCALELALRSRDAGDEHQLWLFDADGARGDGDLDPRGIPVRGLRRQRGFDPGYPRRLAGAFLEAGLDAVHAHNDSALVYAAWALRGLSPRPKLVATFHNLPSHASWGSRRLALAAARRADALVCVSNDLARRLLASDWIPSAAVIHNGVDLRRFAPRPGRARDLARWGLPDRALLVGCVARLAAAKRHADLVDAAVLASARGLAVHLVFVGDGPERAALERRSRGSVGLTFLPFVRDVEALLADLDCAALVSEHEGLPMFLLEAMACGRPVLASAVGGVPELLPAGERSGGLLVEVGDTAAIAAGLQRLTDAGLRGQLGQRARKRVEDCHDLAQVAARYPAHYVGGD